MKVKEENEKVGLKLNIQKTKMISSGPMTSWQIGGETVETVADFIFGGSKIENLKLKNTNSLEEKLWPTWTAYKKAETLFADKGLSSQSYGFSSSHVWMWELNHKEGWLTKNWCFWTVVLEMTLESLGLQANPTSQP